MSAAIVVLPPTVLLELQRQLASAEVCPVCGHEPALLVRGQQVQVCEWHTPECVQLRARPVLSLVPGEVTP